MDWGTGIKGFLKRVRRLWDTLVSPAFREILKFLVFAGILTALLAAGAENLSYRWQWFRVPRYLGSFEDGVFQAGVLLQGLVQTLRISAYGLFFALLIGMAVAFMRLSRSPLARNVARGYLELVRNTPLLIHIFLLYFVFAPVFDLTPFVSAVAALSIFEGAYASEMIRGGIVSIPREQWESAYSLGLPGSIAYRKVILPQAFRLALPPLTSQAITLIKDSALVSTISIYELTMHGQIVVSETFLAFEVWFTVAAIYLILNLILTGVVRFLERRAALNYDI
ncbi:MAG: amino acid ABC transporter permease [Spirochaetaceae bacterium]